MAHLMLLSLELSTNIFSKLIRCSCLCSQLCCSRSRLLVQREMQVASDKMELCNVSYVKCFSNQQVASQSSTEHKVKDTPCSLFHKRMMQLIM